MMPGAARPLNSAGMASSAVDNSWRDRGIVCDLRRSKPIVTIDFEASCLPRHGRSYPIEVGIADQCGSRAWLIRPHPSWTNWHWSEEAEHLHGITLGQLFREGEPVDVVAKALGDALSGNRVISDSEIDSYWLETLASAAGLQAPAKIENVEVVLDDIGATSAEITAVLTKLKCGTFRRHRARHDARWLFALTDSLKSMATTRCSAL